MRFVILIYEAIENPILQRFLEIDTQFNPNYEYQSIDIEKNSLRRSSSECSSLFLEMDKYMKTRFRYILKNKTGPSDEAFQNNSIDNNSVIADIDENLTTIKRLTLKL